MTAMGLAPEIGEERSRLMDPEMVKRTRETVTRTWAPRTSRPSSKLSPTPRRPRVKLTRPSWAGVREAVKRYIPVKA